MAPEFLLILALTLFWPARFAPMRARATKARTKARTGQIGGNPRVM